MKGPPVIIFNKQFQSRRSHFLQDPKSDFFVVLRQKIYPLHKNFISDIGYFSKPEVTQQKVHMLTESIDQKYFQSVVGYFYGIPIEYKRTWGVQLLLKTVQILKIPTITKKVLKDIEQNYDQYGFFLLVMISRKFNVKWLKQRCEEDLTLMNFQQLNFNRYDLFQIDTQTFEQTIKLHELLKINQNIVGLREVQLKRIIRQYCKTNNIKQIQLQNIFINDSTMDQSQIQAQNIQNRDRRHSDPQIYRKQTQQKEKLAKRVSTQAVHTYTSSSNLQNQQKETNDLYNLKIMNTQINQKSNKLLQQISSVNKNLKVTEPEFKQQDYSTIDERFKKFQKTCKEHQQKFLNLRKQMDKLDQQKEKSSDKERKPSPITKKKIQDSSKMQISIGLSGPIGNKSIVSSIPLLNKDDDSQQDV